MVLNENPGFTNTWGQQIGHQPLDNHLLQLVTLLAIFIQDIFHSFLSIDHSFIPFSFFK